MKSTIIIIAIIVIAAAGWYVYAGRQSAGQQAPAGACEGLERAHGLSPVVVGKG